MYSGRQDSPPDILPFEFWVRKAHPPRYKGSFIRVHLQEKRCRNTPRKIEREQTSTFLHTSTMPWEDVKNRFHYVSIPCLYSFLVPHYFLTSVQRSFPEIADIDKTINY